MAAHDLGDPDVEDRRRVRVREVLAGGPHERPAGGPLEGLHARTEADAAEQRPESGAQGRHDGEPPAPGVVGALQSVEGEGIHPGRSVCEPPGMPGACGWGMEASGCNGTVVERENPYGGPRCPAPAAPPRGPAPSRPSCSRSARSKVPGSRCAARSRRRGCRWWTRSSFSTRWVPPRWRPVRRRARPITRTVGSRRSPTCSTA